MNKPTIFQVKPLPGLVCEFPNRPPVLLLEPNADVPNAPPLVVPKPVSEKAKPRVKIKSKSGDPKKRILIFLNILCLNRINSLI